MQKIRTRRQKIINTLAAAVLALLFVAPALAQSGSFVFEDETGNLERSAIEEAAQPLIDRGAVVAVYMVEQGSEADLEQRLRADNLMNDEGRLRQGLIAVYVSADPRTAFLRFEDTWNEALAVNNNYEAILQSALAPELSAGNFTQGYVDTLFAVEDAIVSPPVAGGGNIFNINLIPVVIGVFVLVGLGAGWYVWGKQRSAKKVLADVQKQLGTAKEQAGVAIVETGRLLKTTQEKARFDSVSYDPQDVKQLAATQQQVEQRFVAAQQQFDATEDQLARYEKPPIPDMQQATGAFNSIKQEVDAIHQELDQLIARRAELDQLADQAKQELDRAKKVLTDVAETLMPLQGEIAEPDAVLAPAQQRIEQAVQALENHQARLSLAEAQAASDLAARMTSVVGTYQEIRTGIVQGRNNAEALAAEGYRMETSHAALDRARTALSDAGQMLQVGEPQSAERASVRMQAAQAALEEAVANGRGLAELRTENARRIEEIDALGRQVVQAIVEGRKTFDIVDEFAESTWSDIRGNGSESQAALNRAREHLILARQRNSMDEQEFAEASADLDSAHEELTYAQQLVVAITQRLKDLEAARDTARSELTDAANDIELGWQFVRSNDPDVGKEPEKKLHAAAERLAQAHAEMEQAKPDWLVLVAHAQAANNLADEAMAGARSEVEIMDKLRSKAQRTRQVATGEVQKVVKFVELHRDDIQPENRQTVAQLQQHVEQSAYWLQQAEETEEEERRAALEQAYTIAQQMGQESVQIYNAVQADVARLERAWLEALHAPDGRTAHRTEPGTCPRPRCPAAGRARGSRLPQCA